MSLAALFNKALVVTTLSGAFFFVSTKGMMWKNSPDRPNGWDLENKHTKAAAYRHLNTYNYQTAVYEQSTKSLQHISNITGLATVGSGLLLGASVMAGRYRRRNDSDFD